MSDRPRSLRLPAIALSLILGAPCPPVLAAGIDEATNRPMSIMPTRPFQNVQPMRLQPKQPTLQDLIVRQPMPLEMMQPIPLKGVNIAGLYPKSVEALGFQYFAVVDNTKFLRMSEIYRESRLAGKSNFVTADSIMHPYLAFSNRVLADSTLLMIPDLVSLLSAMEQVALEDYKTADDAEVRYDIERNIAYLSVARRLLNSSTEVPRVGDVPELVDAEMQAIVGGKAAHSAIFDSAQDYSVFSPQGWYRSSPQLQNFYRCREWLSLVPFAINDAGQGRGNMFRRSVLMFRCLDQGNILGKPAMDTWVKLVRAYNAIGTPLESWGQRTLYPQDYKLVLQDRASNLKVTLQALAEPFFRTKLMLAVRNQKPMNLDSESIFDLSGSDAGGSMPVFRLFPMFGEPEVPWFRGIAHLYPADKTKTCSWPLGLLDMYAFGSAQAGNVLADMLYMVEPNIAKLLPALQHCVARRTPSGQLANVDSRAWTLASNLFKPLPQGVPGVLHTDLWYTQRLLSAFGAWIDTSCAITPSDEPTAQMAASATGPAADSGANGSPNNNTSEGISPPPASADAAAVPRRVKKIPPYHFLEPNLDLYHTLQTDAEKLQLQLQSVGYFPQKYKARLGDFVRLFQRLQKIAEAELRQQPISVMDRRLLADIDLILDKVDVPLPAVLSFNGGKSREEAEMVPRGINLAIGRPGILYVIIQDPHTAQWTVGRGAVYTTYEMPAPLLTDSMWKHKIEAGFAVPPCWSDKFELVQKAKPEH